MNGAEIQTHLTIWLKEDQNPYIGIKRSWEEYCKEELNIEPKETLGVLLSTLQVYQIRCGHVEEAIKQIQNK